LSLAPSPARNVSMLDRLQPLPLNNFRDFLTSEIFSKKTKAGPKNEKECYNLLQ